MGRATICRLYSALDLLGAVDALKDPSSIILSQSVAKALFADEDPLGKAVRVDNNTDMKVAAIYKDLPANTTMNETKFLLSWNNAANKFNKQTDQWENHGSQLFVELNDQYRFCNNDCKSERLTKAIYKRMEGRIIGASNGQMVFIQ